MKFSFDLIVQGPHSFETAKFLTNRDRCNAKSIIAIKSSAISGFVIERSKGVTFIEIPDVGPFRFRQNDKCVPINVGRWLSQIEFALKHCISEYSVIMRADISVDWAKIDDITSATKGIWCTNATALDPFWTRTSLHFNDWLIGGPVEQLTEHIPTFKEFSEIDISGTIFYDHGKAYCNSVRSEQIILSRSVIHNLPRVGKRNKALEKQLSWKITVYNADPIIITFKNKHFKNQISLTTMVPKFFSVREKIEFYLERYLRTILQKQIIIRMIKYWKVM